MSDALPKLKWMEIKKRKKIYIRVIKDVWEDNFRNVSGTEMI